MNNKLNETVLLKILNIIPAKIKPVNLFMNVLDIGKESAYRRLRGEKPLSFEEIHKLSLELGFSMDGIVDYRESSNLLFNHIGTYTQNPEKNLLEFLYYYESYLKHLTEANNAEIVCTINHFLNTMFVGNEHLFKFIYYKWIHQVKDVPFNYLYADLTVPLEIKDLCERLADLSRKIKKLTFIVDNSLFLNLVKEMQYFHIRNLINQSELNKLKEEFQSYLYQTENTIKKGTDTNGTIVEIYLSVFNINSTTTYSHWDGNEESAFWHYHGYPLLTRDKRITMRHRYWINSLKKYTTVISQSNELLQADFFNKQRSYIDNMVDTILL